MELAKQIKKYRTDFGLSQEELAEKLYVSRQTVSNWENDKSYPDIKSVALMSYIFNISVDELIKGSPEEVNELIIGRDREDFEKYSIKMTVLLIVCIVSLWPLLHYIGLWGTVAWVSVYAMAMYYTIKIEKLKKKFNIQTYKEIDAFMNEKRLNEAEKNQEYGKRKYQHVLLGMASAAITLGVALLLALLFGDL